MFIQSTAYRTIYGGSMGGGKAQPLHSKVLTPDGWKTMGEIKVGSEVLTPDNKVTTVLETYNFDSKPIYKLVTNSGTTTECCDEHLWNVYVSSKKYKGSWQTLETSEILKIMESGETVRLPVAKATGLTQDIELPIDPYVIGVLIAEGGLTQGLPIFTNTDHEIIDRVRDWASALNCKLSPTKNGMTFRIVKNHNTYTRNDKGQFEAIKNPVKQLIEDVALAGTSSFTKFIPKVYLHSSIEQRKELLRALMDCDGSVDKQGSTCEYTTVSKQLCEDVCYLVRSLGGLAKVKSRYPTYTHNGEKRTGALAYRIYVKFEDSSDIFYCSRKKSRGKKRKTPLLDEIVSLEYVSDQPCQCIYIEDREHLYVTDDFIVTHNTHMGLMRFLLYVDDPNFVGFVIRKNASDLRGAGGAFDEAVEMFTKYDPKAKVIKMPMQITLSNGAKIFFTGLDGDKGMKSLQGKQIGAIMLDEATHFTEEEIVWAESRLRTKAKMIPNIWLTCNPDKQSVIYDWIKDYYLYPRGMILDGEDVGGRANPDKDGVVRYFLKVGNTTEWGNTRQELIDKFGSKFPKNKETGETTASPKSFTFISATCLDNPPLLAANPDYVSTLASLPRITREKALYGNWEVQEENAGYFKRDWLEFVDSIPCKVKRRVRCWDIAATKPSESSPHPDYTASVMMSYGEDGYYYIEDARRNRISILDVVDWIIDTGIADQQYCNSIVNTFIPQDPNAQARWASQQWVNECAKKGVAVRLLKHSPHNSKLSQFLPFSALAETGLVKMVKGDWNDWLLDEMEAFTGKRSTAYLKDDGVDCVSACQQKLATNKELPNFNGALLRL